jgi:serine/threonine protein phosphatase PrpC
MPLRLSVAGHSDVGRVRELNEDSFYYRFVQTSDEDSIGLFIVADGMGGHMAGEVASHWTVQTLKRELAPMFMPRDPAITRRLKQQEVEALLKGERLTTRLDETDTSKDIRDAIKRTNEVLLGYSRQKPEEAGNMGSTVTLVVVHGEQAVVANVGDSRTYLWHDSDLRQLTTDHSVPGALVAAGQLDPEEIYDHPQRHVIYNCLGFKEKLETEIIQPVSLQPGDALLLCSDGLWEMVRPTKELAALFAKTPDVEATCRRLVDEANKRGGEDNITVVIVRMEE